MKKILILGASLVILLGFLNLFNPEPLKTTSIVLGGTPTSWDYASNVLQPLRSQWAAEVKGNNFTATSTLSNNTFPKLLFTTATGTSATTTNFATTNLCISGDCKAAWPGAGAQTPWAQDIDGGGFSLSNVLGITSTRSTTTNATTTNLFSTTLTATTSFFTNLFIGVDTLAEYIADTAGTMFTGNTETGITVTYQDADNTVDVVCDTASGSIFGCLSSTDWTTFNSKESALTFSTGLSRSVNTITVDQAFSPTWTGAHIFNNITRSTTTQATTTNFFTSFFNAHELRVGGSATTTISTAGSLALPTGATLTVTDITSALTLTGAGGIFAEYTGTTCTNQFVRALSALGVATCATVVAGDVDLADLTATNGTLTFSGAYDGQIARTIGLNLGNVNTWTALQTINNASTTNLTTGSYFQLPVASSFSNFQQGSLSFDSTSGNLVMGTTTVPSATAHVVIGSATTTLYSFAVSSTSPDFVSGGIIELPAHFLPQVVTGVICKLDGGTSWVINLDDGTNNSTSATCTTTSTQFPITTNNTFTAYETIRFEGGTIVGSPDRISVRFIGYRTSD